MYNLRGASEVVTAKPTLKHLSGEAMGIVDRRANTDVLIEGDKIVKVSKNIEAPGAEIIDVTGKVIVPGFVDPHTHLVWAGSREHELEWKLEGKTYQDILANGGGILRTVKETRSVDEEELQSQTLKRFKKAMSHGTTTIEIKSGYGLEEETELKQLSVANWLKSFNLADIVVTFMGAHAFPEDLNKYEYVEEVIRMLPLVKDLAEYCDVFCEEGAFTVDESREILEAAKSLGFKLKIHADEFGDTGGGRLGADLGVVTADHLAGSSLETIKMLSRSGAIGVLLPGTPFALLSDHYSPARKMIANNLPIALATDCNQYCNTESMKIVQQ